MAHALSWFEIPVTHFNRAKAFYEKVLGIAIEPMPMGSDMMGMLSTDANAVGGAIVQSESASPSQSGTLVYLNGGEDLAPMLARVEQAGGSVAVPKTEIGGGFGFFAHFIDTEGNKVGLHSMRDLSAPPCRKQGQAHCCERRPVPRIEGHWAAILDLPRHFWSASMQTVHLAQSAKRAAATALLLLMVPLVAMQFTSEVVWGPGDFLVG